MTNLLNGKVALVTGAFSGLGLHFAKTLANQGAKVILSGRRLELGQSVAQELRDSGRFAEAVQMDVTRPESVQSVMDHVLADYGAIDITVNNAGIASTGPAMDTTAQAWSAVVETNLTGVWNVAKFSALAMRQQPTGGSIINIASILGLRVAQQVPAYAASKAAVLQLTRALALEWAKHRIRVNAIAPGYLETDLNGDFFSSEDGKSLIKRIPQRRLGLPAELDGALLLLASSASSYMTGSTLVLDGGHSINSI